MVGWGSSLVLGPFSLDGIVCGRFMPYSFGLCSVFGHLEWCETTLLVDMFVNDENIGWVEAQVYCRGLRLVWWNEITHGIVKSQNKKKDLPNRVQTMFRLMPACVKCAEVV